MVDGRKPEELEEVQKPVKGPDLVEPETTPTQGDNSVVLSLRQAQLTPVTDLRTLAGKLSSQTEELSVIAPKADASELLEPVQSGNRKLTRGFHFQDTVQAKEQKEGSYQKHFDAAGGKWKQRRLNTALDKFDFSVLGTEENARAWLEKNPQYKDSYESMQRLNKLGIFGPLDRDQKWGEYWQTGKDKQLIDLRSATKEEFDRGDFRKLDKLEARDFKLAYSFLSDEQRSEYNAYNHLKRAVQKGRQSGDYSDLAEVNPKNRSFQLWFNSASEQERKTWADAVVKAHIDTSALNTETWFKNASPEMKKHVFDAVKDRPESEREAWWSRNTLAKADAERPLSQTQIDYLLNLKGEFNVPESAERTEFKVEPVKIWSDQKLMSVGDYHRIDLIAESTSDKDRADYVASFLNKHPEHKASIDQLKSASEKYFAALLTEKDAPGKDMNERLEKYQNEWVVNRRAGFERRYEILKDGEEFRQWLQNAPQEEVDRLDLYLASREAGDYSFVNKNNFSQFKELASQADQDKQGIFRKRVESGEYFFQFLHKKEANKSSILNQDRFTEDEFKRFKTFQNKLVLKDYSSFYKHEPQMQQAIWNSLTLEQKQDAGNFKEQILSGNFSASERYFAWRYEKEPEATKQQKIAEARQKWIAENADMTFDGKKVPVKELYDAYVKELERYRAQDRYRELDAMAADKRQEAVKELDPNLKEGYEEWQVNQLVGNFSWMNRLPLHEQRAQKKRYEDAIASKDPVLLAEAKAFKAFEAREQFGDKRHVYLLPPKYYEQHLKHATTREKEAVLDYVNQVDVGNFNSVAAYDSEVSAEWAQTLQKIKDNPGVLAGYADTDYDPRKLAAELLNGKGNFDLRIKAGDRSMFEKLNNRNWVRFAARADKEELEQQRVFKHSTREKEDFGYVDRLRMYGVAGKDEADRPLDAWLKTRTEAEKLAYIEYRNKKYPEHKISRQLKGKELDDAIRAEFVPPAENGACTVENNCIENEPKQGFVKSASPKEAFAAFLRDMAAADTPEKKVEAMRRRDSQERQLIGEQLVQADLEEKGRLLWLIKEPLANTRDIDAAAFVGELRQAANASLQNLENTKDLKAGQRIYEDKRTGKVFVSDKVETDAIYRELSKEQAQKIYQQRKSSYDNFRETALSRMGERTHSGNAQAQEKPFEGLSSRGKTIGQIQSSIEKQKAPDLPPLPAFKPGAVLPTAATDNSVAIVNNKGVVLPQAGSGEAQSLLKTVRELDSSQLQPSAPVVQSEVKQEPVRLLPKVDAALLSTVSNHGSSPAKSAPVLTAHRSDENNEVNQKVARTQTVDLGGGRSQSFAPPSEKLAAAYTLISATPSYSGNGSISGQRADSTVLSAQQRERSDLLMRGISDLVKANQLAHTVEHDSNLPRPELARKIEAQKEEQAVYYGLSQFTGGPASAKSTLLPFALIRDGSLKRASAEEGQALSLDRFLSLQKPANSSLVSSSSRIESVRVVEAVSGRAAALEALSQGRIVSLSELAHSVRAAAQINSADRTLAGDHGLAGRVTGKAVPSEISGTKAAGPASEGIKGPLDYRTIIKGVELQGIKASENSGNLSGVIRTDGRLIDAVRTVDASLRVDPLTGRILDSRVGGHLPPLDSIRVAETIRTSDLVSMRGGKIIISDFKQDTGQASLLPNGFRPVAVVENIRGSERIVIRDGKGFAVATGEPISRVPGLLPGSAAQTNWIIVGSSRIEGSGIKSEQNADLTVGKTFSISGSTGGVKGQGQQGTQRTNDQIQPGGAAGTVVVQPINLPGVTIVGQDPNAAADPNQVMTANSKKDPNDPDPQSDPNSATDPDPKDPNQSKDPNDSSRSGIVQPSGQTPDPGKSGGSEQHPPEAGRANRTEIASPAATVFLPGGSDLADNPGRVVHLPAVEPLMITPDIHAPLVPIIHPKEPDEQDIAKSHVGLPSLKQEIETQVALNNNHLQAELGLPDYVEPGRLDVIDKIEHSAHSNSVAQVEQGGENDQDANQFDLSSEIENIVSRIVDQNLISEPYDISDQNKVLPPAMDSTPQPLPLESDQATQLNDAVTFLAEAISGQSSIEAIAEQLIEPSKDIVHSGERIIADLGADVLREVFSTDFSGQLTAHEPSLLLPDEQGAGSELSEKMQDLLLDLAQTDSSVDEILKAKLQYEKELDEKSEREKELREKEQARLREEEAKRAAALYDKLKGLPPVRPDKPLPDRKQVDVDKSKGLDLRNRQTHVVLKGDTLESIAAKRLNNKKLAALIYQLNRSKIPVIRKDGKPLLQLKPRTMLLLPSQAEIIIYLSANRKAINFEYDQQTDNGTLLSLMSKRKR